MRPYNLASIINIEVHMAFAHILYISETKDSYSSVSQWGNLEKELLLLPLID